MQTWKSLVGHPRSRIKAVHTVHPCSAQIPTVATRAGLCDGCFGASITCFWWLDCERRRALMTLRCQKQQHACLNTMHTSTSLASDNEACCVCVVVRSSRVFTLVNMSKTTLIVMHLWPGRMRKDLSTPYVISRAQTTNRPARLFHRLVAWSRLHSVTSRV